MRTPKSFRSISERLPSFRHSKRETDSITPDVQPSQADQAPVADDSQDIFSYLERELTKNDFDEAHLTLAASLDELDLLRRQPSPEEDTMQTEQTIKEVIKEKGHDLAARTLPVSVAEVLDLKPAHVENLRSEDDRDNIMSLRTLYLLIHAYDDTHDETLKNSIEYILEYSPPHLSELLAEAYTRGKQGDDPIMREYRNLAAAYDTEIEEPRFIYGEPTKEKDRKIDPFLARHLAGFLRSQKEPRRPIKFL